MSDLIERDKAKMAVRLGMLSAATIYGRTDEGMIARKEIERAIDEVPSEQTTQNNRVNSDIALDLIERQAAIDIELSATVDTNPTHFEAHQKFTQFMDDAEISSFGRWQWSNGFNTALTAVGIDLKKLPTAQPEPQWNRMMMYLADLQLTYSPNWGANGQGDKKLYDFVTGLIEELEGWTEPWRGEEYGKK